MNRRKPLPFIACAVFWPPYEAANYEWAEAFRAYPVLALDRETMIATLWVGHTLTVKKLRLASSAEEALEMASPLRHVIAAHLGPTEAAEENGYTIDYKGIECALKHPPDPWPNPYGRDPFEPEPM